MNQEGSGSSLPISAALKGAKSKSRGKGKGSPEGKFCRNCGKLGHVANKCLEPPIGKAQGKGGSGKGGKDGKGKGSIRSIQDLFANINLKVPHNVDKGKSLGCLGKFVCNITRLEAFNQGDHPCRQGPSLEDSRWTKATKTCKLTRFMKVESQKEKRNEYSALEDEQDDDDNEDEPGDQIMMKCERCTFGVETSEHTPATVQCLGCKLMTTRLLHPLANLNGHTCLRKSRAQVEEVTTTPSPIALPSGMQLGPSGIGKELKKKRIRCVTKMSINNVAEEELNKIDGIALKLENLKILGDQIRDSLNKVNAKNIENSKDWTRLSLTVDSGACENVVDPRDVLGYPLKETMESRNGETFVTASGDPHSTAGIEGGNSADRRWSAEGAEVTMHHCVKASSFCQTGDRSWPLRGLL